MSKRIKASELNKLDLSKISDGANYIFDDEKPIAVVMNIKYYKYIEALMKELKNRITK